jgi:hypothetical protein
VHTGIRWLASGLDSIHALHIIYHNSHHQYNCIVQLQCLV